MDQYPYRSENYLPKKIEVSEDEPIEKPKTLTEGYQHKDVATKFGEAWDLDSNEIFYGLRLSNKKFQIRVHEELHIAYGNQANHSLFNVYGFTLKDNRFDFVRRKDITAHTFFP